MYALAACDEMIDRSGRIRAPWVPVMAAVRDIGPEELARRSVSLNRQMRLAAPFGAAPSQHYDLLPAPLITSEFTTLEAGLRQRARLLNAALEDIYGQQALLREGYFPPALVFGNPHFLRSLHTRQPLGFPRLSFYAADVIRGPDGRFQVLRDHTGVIPGLGHALTLRRLAASTVPELFRAGGLRSLRPAREMLMDHLQRHAKGGLVAVLSAGIDNAERPAACRHPDPRLAGDRSRPAGARRTARGRHPRRLRRDPRRSADDAQLARQRTRGSN